MNESIESIHGRYREFNDEAISVEQRLDDAKILTDAGYKLIRGFAAAAMVGHNLKQLIHREVTVWMENQQIDDGNVIGPMVISGNSGALFTPERSRAEWQPVENDEAS